MSSRTIHAAARSAGLLVAAVVACLAGTAMPTLAAARGDVGCRVNDHVLRITIDAGGSVHVYRSAAGTIIVNRHTCHALGGPAADVWNTKQIQIFGDDGSENVTIDLRNGGFAPGFGDESGTTDEIEFAVLLGEGWDQLRIDGTDDVDTIAFGTKPGQWVPLPSINLNATDSDHDVTYLRADYVIAWGHGGADVITGNDPDTGVASLPIRITGGPGADTLTGGDAADRLWGDGGPDTLKGGKGADKLDTEDGVNGNDEAYGGPDADDCVSDPGDLQASC